MTKRFLNTCIVDVIRQFCVCVCVCKWLFVTECTFKLHENHQIVGHFAYHLFWRCYSNMCGWPLGMQLIHLKQTPWDFLNRRTQFVRPPFTTIGPVLPAHGIRVTTIGPLLPIHGIWVTTIGPVLPVHETGVITTVVGVVHFRHPRDSDLYVSLSFIN